MPIQNIEIAWALDSLADLAEIDGDNPYRVRAYRTAARTVGQLDEPLHAWVEADADLTTLPGIGGEMAAKIREFVRTGRLETLDQLAEHVPLSLRDLLALPGVGAKQVRTLHAELGIRTLDELIEALDNGQVGSLRGFGAKRVRGLREAAERAIRRERRWRIDVAEQLSEPLMADLQSHDAIIEVGAAGSLRRRCETVGDVDIVVVTQHPEVAADAVAAHDDVDRVIERDEWGVKAELRSGLSMEVRLAGPSSSGIAWLDATGSSAHRAALHERARDGGMELREDGLVRDGQVVASEAEGAVYAALGLDWIPPELREGRGEVEAAARGDLPDLITVDAIRGDLQMHTTFSDGAHTLAEMTEAARSRGYAYIAITDHSQRMRVANGLSPERLRDQLAQIDDLNAEYDDIAILKSCEVDVLEDGTLDMPDDVLEELDLVVVSVHSKFDLTRDAQTERICRALAHPAVRILAHPTGRVVNRRLPYDVDIERVIAATIENDVGLEINASPQRLDLKDEHV
ncbi:MAG: DNA polymerase/3'-5' exonuclease PolX, partial [Candidatus Bipolaricaulia bacterium]